jgi:hypothetical protein
MKIIFFFLPQIVLLLITSPICTCTCTHSVETHEINNKKEQQRTCWEFLIKSKLCVKKERIKWEFKARTSSSSTHMSQIFQIN